MKKNYLLLPCLFLLLPFFVLPLHAQTVHKVTVSSNVFTPRDIVIQQGDVVEWTNVQGFHNVNGSKSVFPKNRMSFANFVAGPGWVYSVTFDKEGFYEYQCDPHVFLDMFGTITVEPKRVKHAVEVSSNVFTPADLTIFVGDTVEWTNVQGFHNVNATLATYPNNPEGFGNSVAGPGWVFSHVFTEQGFYDYRCDPHVGIGMVGTIHVLPQQITHCVQVSSNVFTPRDIRIHRGDRVLWTNVQGFHNVNGNLSAFPNNPEGFGNAVAGPGWDFNHVFGIEGFYDYQCDPHVPLNMFGTIDVITCSGKDPFEPNNEKALAQSLTAGVLSGTGNKHLCPAGDVDWYRVNVTTPGQNLRIRLQGLPGDYDLEVHDGLGLLGSSTNLGFQNEEVLVQGATGSYFIKVFGKPGAFSDTRPYDLVVGRAKPTPPGLTGTKPPVNDPLLKTDLADEALSIYPNPAQNRIQGVFTSANMGPAALRLTDMFGKLVHSEELSLQKGENLIRISVEGQAAGMYLLEIQKDGISQSEKVFITK